MNLLELATRLEKYRASAILAILFIRISKI